MSAIYAAIVAAALGFGTKIVIDLRTEHQIRNSIAAALAGELGAYLKLGRLEKTIPNIKGLAELEYSKRNEILHALPPLPSGHPVFDRVADRIGVLSPEAARGISEAYNIVTGGRLLLMYMSSDAFRQLQDQEQVNFINNMTDVFTPSIEEIGNTLALLDNLSCQSFFHYLMHLVGRDSQRTVARIDSGQNDRTRHTL